MEKAGWSPLFADRVIIPELFRWRPSVNQQHTDEKSEQNHEWSQLWWIHADWISSDRPKQKQWQPLRKREEGRRMAPLLPKVIVACCGVCTSLVPRHIFFTGLRSKTINSWLMTLLNFKHYWPLSGWRQLLHNKPCFLGLERKHKNTPICAQ